MSINPKYLGGAANYDSAYDNTLLEPIPRARQRECIGITNDLPFYGHDIWNAYEISWLSPSGKPMNALGEFYIPCESPYLVESKSFKLYLVSLTQSTFEHIDHVQQTLADDLSTACGAPVSVMLSDLQSTQQDLHACLPGVLIDHLPIESPSYHLNPALLAVNTDKHTSETLVSNLLKSNCLVTNQPDWATLQIDYTGPQIVREQLLHYIIGFREHNEFHEHCVERIFLDIVKQCQPEYLTVYARYTRRGGLDINPYRTTSEKHRSPNIRLIRQ